MSYQPDLSTIQESSIGSANQSPTKSTDSEYSMTQSKKRNILSGLNFRNYANLEEESIVEEDSSFFDESNAAYSGLPVERQGSLPIMNGTPPIVQNTIRPTTAVNPDEIKVAQKENYNIESAIKDAGSVGTTGGKPKRIFLKRGQGKNCLHPGARQSALLKNDERSVNTDTKKKPVTKSNLSGQKQRTQQRKSIEKPCSSKTTESTLVGRRSLPKHPPVKERTEPVQRSLFKNPPDLSHQIVSNDRLAVPLTNTIVNPNPKSLNRYFSQSPEDSINISIQNEKQYNERLDQIDREQAAEFDLMEQLIQDNSKLDLTEVVEDLIHNSNPSSQPSSNTSIIENYHKKLSQNIEPESFDPHKYNDDIDSFYDSPKETAPVSNSINMTRKTSKIRHDDEQQYESLPSSISTDYDDLPTPLNEGFNRDLDFSDVSPWDDTIKDTSEQPSFSTPAKTAEVSAPTRLMSKIFKTQVQNSKVEESRVEKQQQKQDDEIAQLRKDLENQKLELKRESDRFKRETKALEDLRKRREREMEIFNLEITRREREFDDRTKTLSNWEKEIGQKVRDCKKIEALHRDAERSGTVRRKDLDQFKVEAASKERELTEKLNRLAAQTARLKTENERLEKLQKATRNENVKLNDQIDQIMRNSKRKEGATWREINRIVDQATAPNMSISRAPPPIRPTKLAIQPAKRDSLNLSSASSINSRDGLMEPTIEPPAAAIVESSEQDGKIMQRLASGKIITKFSNGTVKEKSADGATEIFRYQNGDVQQTLPDGKVVYYYANNGASSTRFSDGKEVLEFPNGQKEIVNADGTREIIFPDNIREKTHLSGKKETFYQDGSRKILGINGDEVVFFRDGQKETRTATYRRREMPDGTTKTVFLDTNYTETRYATGRVRIKDASGKIIVDQKPAA